MRGQIESLLERGIKAARAGEERRARDILIHVIELDQRNEKAWLWLSSVVETTADRIMCLENVLTVNPDNTYAAAGLQRLREQPLDSTAPRSLLPRLGGPREPDQVARKAAAVPPAPTADRVCPRCGLRNPGWAYLCDRCGADLRPVDVREALGLGSRPRGRSFVTLVAAWAAAFTLHRRWAFLPEVELASWGRSLAALVMAVLCTSACRALTTVALRLWVGGGRPGIQIATVALRCAAATLKPALLLALAYVPVALLAWVGAWLVGGRQRFKTHVHLTAVAFSAWVVLIALLASLATFLPHLLDRRRFDLLLSATPVLLGVVVGLMGVTWLTQAVRTAYRLPATRAFLVTLLVTALGGAFVFGLDLFGGERFAGFLGTLALLFLPWPGCGA
jgi:ribosomal protein L40E